ncbi:hypothetical protein HK107_04085 [Parvularcula sp. ZS-1/3]|uniref:Uncharacterized protein n=1 Tax=Parvularcula mediterranea TaxID=2732508 RepID=A0A7Y3RK16_9PROT|nr:hypothetical protein [Parvularcula mediterranea]NNU15499.1 hypothetical protein [Parvularcula mediterranea]
MIEQDDLLLLSHLRTHAVGNDEMRARSCDALAEDPGRAAGRVLGWALQRTLEHLRRHGRRGWRMDQGVVPSPQETRLLSMIRAIADRREDEARQAALWLVPEREVQTLLDRAAPLLGFYAPAIPERRRAAATA